MSSSSAQGPVPSDVFWIAFFLLGLTKPFVIH